MSVFVLYSNKQPAMPCTPKRARLLLERKQAAVYRMKPFTIILKRRANGIHQPIELKYDPGSITTGIAAVSQNTIIFAAELQHHGNEIKEKLQTRASLRRGRRNRKTRYRQARFLNRKRKENWLPPSIQSRVDNIKSWTQKLLARLPITSIAIEHVKFDMQKMQNPEISGIEYQQGQLQGYEIREYLLEKFNRTCIYCDKKNVPLEIEHLTPKSRGGSNRISNLGLSCHNCNQLKDNQTVQEFVTDTQRQKKILQQAKTSLKDAAAVNSTRNAIIKMMKNFNLPLVLGSGAQTKMNRIAQNYPKAHWIDAACIGITGNNIALNPAMKFLKIKAIGRGNRQMVKVNKFGLPHGTPKGPRRKHNLSTGDLVKAMIKQGKNPGTFLARIKSVGSKRFDIESIFGIVGTTAKNLILVQRNDGYKYA